MGLSALLENLPESIKTPISKIIDNGMDRSSGEWQRIALSKHVVSEALLKLLDGTTAAFEPMSECRLY